MDAGAAPAVAVRRTVATVAGAVRHCQHQDGRPEVEDEAGLVGDVGSRGGGRGWGHESLWVWRERFKSPRSEISFLLTDFILSIIKLLLY